MSQLQRKGEARCTYPRLLAWDYQSFGDVRENMDRCRFWSNFHIIRIMAVTSGQCPLLAKMIMDYDLPAELYSK